MVAPTSPARGRRRPAAPEGSIWVAGDGIGGARADVGLFVEALAATRVWLALWLVLCLGTAVAVIRSTPSEYIATTRILLEPRWLGPAAVERAGQGRRVALDDVQSRTQLAIMRSPAALRRIFDALDVAGSPDVAAERDDAWTRLGRFVRGHVSAGRGVAQRHPAFDRFLDRLLVRRLSNSYVFEFTYRSLSPERAASIADAAASAYVLGRIESVIAQAQAGAFALKGSVADVSTETKIASEAVLAGRPVTADLPDAGVQSLGPAIVPLVAVSPRPGLILALAACLSAVSGLLAVMVASRLRRTLRSRRQFRLRCGLDCLCIRLTDGADGRSSRRSAGFMSLDRALLVLRATLAAEGLLTGQRAIGLASWMESASCGLIAGRLQQLLAGSEACRTPAQASEDPHGSVSHLQAGAALNDLRLTTLTPLRYRPPEHALSELDGIVLVLDAGRSTFRQVRAAIEAVQSRKGSLRAVLLVEGTLPNLAAR